MRCLPAPLSALKSNFWIFCILHSSFRLPPKFPLSAASLVGRVASPARTAATAVRSQVSAFQVSEWCPPAGCRFAFFPLCLCVSVANPLSRVSRCSRFKKITGDSSRHRRFKFQLLPSGRDGWPSRPPAPSLVVHSRILRPKFVLQKSLFGAPILWRAWVANFAVTTFRFSLSTFRFSLCVSPSLWLR